jgi:predicted alpha/beta-fold hydrolase
VPLITSSYKTPFFYLNKHVQTIFSSLLRKKKTCFFIRKRIQTSDNDFLDLDLILNKNKKCIILSHGLEGNSYRSYITNMAQHLIKHGYDICAWNFRGCSGEINKQIRMYHSGSTNDLDEVVDYVKSKYDEVYLVGFSMGGNLTLKFLGEKGNNLNHKIKGAVTFSVPTDLSGSCDRLEKWYNRIYMKRFLTNLKGKLIIKQNLFPNQISLENYDSIKSFREFDERYTAPIHGFKNANDYYEKCSSKQFISLITVPTLIVNAKDDPFLSKSCFPVEECMNNKNVYLEIPNGGGHVGFMLTGSIYWSEKRTLEFFNEINT